MPRLPRRLFACLIGATVAVTAAASAATASATGASSISEAKAQQIGTDAYVYGISLMEFLRQRETQTSVTVPNGLSDAPINQLGNQRNLADAGTPGLRRAEQRHPLHRWAIST